MRLSLASYCMRSPSRLRARTTTWLGLVTRRYQPVTAQNIFEKLAAYQPLDSVEYRALEAEVIKDFQHDLDHLEDLLDGPWD